MPVLEASVDQYGDGAKLESFYRRDRNFGQAYNEAVRWTFEEYPDCERFIIANDDVVLRPDTLALMCEDADRLDHQGIEWSHIAARFDRGAYTLQNLVRNPFESEPLVFEERWIAPVFSMIHRRRWVDFPPINWGSDVVQCFDMRANGYKIFVSRAYVHHVGGITCGADALADREASRRWLAENRPGLVDLI
ncbi:MAG TPA: hypothetical protein DCZ59_04320 [Bacteroidetes bacterium]|nr:hypothetical protein [Bacteroidota bacterium]